MILSRLSATARPLYAIVALLVVISSSTGAYFADIETSAGNVFQAGVWVDPQSPFNIVLNEFLPNPDNNANGLNFGTDSSNMPLGEWVELYNNGNAPIDVNGWYMTDASGGVGNTHAFINNLNTNTGNTILAANGWLVVYFNKASLNNTGDDIFLYTSTSTGNVLVDTYSYDDPSDFCELEPTPGDENSTTTPTGTPGNGPNADCVANQVAPNKSYARIPDGTGAFVDPIPTPGAPNVLDETSAEAQAETEQSQRGSTSLDAEEELVVEIGEPVIETTITEENPIVEEEPIVEISEPAAEETTPEESLQGPTLLEGQEPVVEISEPVIEIVEETPPAPEPALEPEIPPVEPSVEPPPVEIIE